MVYEGARAQVDFAIDAIDLIPQELLDSGAVRVATGLTINNSLIQSNATKWFYFGKFQPFTGEMSKLFLILVRRTKLR